MLKNLHIIISNFTSLLQLFTTINVGSDEMEKMLKQFTEADQKLFRNVNQLFERKYLNVFFRNITHCGGATFTISSLLLLIIFTSGPIRFVALASAISLAVSHMPVAVLKKMYPRKRPYLVLDEINVTDKPLKDHSFPSGHTTAIFSVVVPFILYDPFLAIVLVPLAVSVGVSRMYLGLHYPSDVLAGIALGNATGILAYQLVANHFSYGML